MHGVKTISILSEEEEAFSIWDRRSICALYKFVPLLGLNCRPQFYTSQENYLNHVREFENAISVTMIDVMLM